VAQHARAVVGLAAARRRASDGEDLFGGIGVPTVVRRDLLAAAGDEHDADHDGDAHDGNDGAGGGSEGTGRDTRGADGTTPGDGGGGGCAIDVPHSGHHRHAGVVAVSHFGQFTRFRLRRRSDDRTVGDR